MIMITVKSIFAPVTDDDGFRVFVDPVWPKQASRGKTILDVWFRDLAPSPELYLLYANNLLKWEDFVARYHRELAWQRDYFADLQAHNRNGGLTILNGSRNDEQNIAVALKMFLDRSETAPAGGTGSA